MKRTPLKRKTPLKSKTPLKQGTKGLKRTPIMPINLVWIDPKSGTHFHKYNASRKKNMAVASNVCIDNRYELTKLDYLDLKRYKPCIVCYPYNSLIGHKLNKFLQRDKKRKHNHNNGIPQSVKSKVLERSGGICEEPNCKTPYGDFRGLMFCHIIHRKMGSRKGLAREIINDSRNIFYGCGNAHDKADGRIDADKPLERLALRAKIKAKIGWYDWATQYGVVDNGNKPLNR